MIAIKGDNMTGTFLRVKRNGKFENVEIEYLTESELEVLFAQREPSELLRWLIHLVNVLRPIAKYMDKEPDVNG